jgi:hypothetical protein
MKIRTLKHRPISFVASMNFDGCLQTTSSFSFLYLFDASKVKETLSNYTWEDFGDILMLVRIARHLDYMKNRFKKID